MSAVERFERAFAEYVGAEHCIALCNGTATLHTALAALGVAGDHQVAVPPLTMASTTIAVLHAGGVPVFVDVNPDTWLMNRTAFEIIGGQYWSVPVSLYGLHWQGLGSVDDAAQTLRPHHDIGVQFTSYSFQASKILPLGEGGMLATNDAELAGRARRFSSLGYPLTHDSPVISKRVLKDPRYQRHFEVGWNYRMAESVARTALAVAMWDDHVHGYWTWLKNGRQEAAALYRDAIDGCSWITPQHVPDGWTHDYWCYAVALESAELWHPFVDAIERHGGERPYAAWRITYQEPAFRHLAEDGTCPVAEDLQPRLAQFQTNSLESAKRNAAAVDAAIYELNGVPA